MSNINENQVELLKTIAAALAQLVDETTLGEFTEIMLDAMHHHELKNDIKPAYYDAKIPGIAFTPTLEYDAADALKAAIEHHENSLSQFALQAKVSHAYLRELCTGKIGEITPENAYKISKSTGFKIKQWHLCPALKPRQQPVAEDFNLPSDFDV